MPEQPVERRICVRRVFRSGGSVRGDVCQLPPIVEVEGEWYCRVHNPDARVKRAKALKDKWAAEQQRLDARRMQTAAIHAAERRVIEAAKEWAVSAYKNTDKIREAVLDLEEVEHA